MAIAAGLAPTLGRPTATTIVLGFFNRWVAAVGCADAAPAVNYFFALGLVRSDDDERRFREILVTDGTTDRIMSDLHDVSSVIAVNITDILARLRAKARAAGIDLSQAFFSLPTMRGSPRSSPSSSTSARHESRACGGVKRSGGATKH
jgi:hypothetical protein